MIVLGIDPGATTGWVRYDTGARRALASGDFRGNDLPDDAAQFGAVDHCIIESLHEPRGNIYPAVVQAGITQGHIERQIPRHIPQHRITRAEVKAILTDAMLREPVVQTDKHVWQALLALHGGEAAAKKGGPLHGVKSHGRAALAVAVAWGIQTGSVITKNGNLVLTGPYQWRAAVAHLIHDHINREGGNEWCTLGCFARFLEGRAIASAMDRARDRIATLAKELLQHGEFLIIDYGGPGGAKSAMRLLRMTDDPDVATVQIDRMVQMRDATAERARVALEIIRKKRQLADPSKAEQP